MEKLGPQFHENDSKMHSRIIDTYNQLAREYEALFEKNESVNPANEKHLKILEDYLDKRGLSHNNFFIHDHLKSGPNEEEVSQVIDDYSSNRIDELTRLIEKMDEKINQLETHAGNIDQKTIDHQINIYQKLRSQYIKQYRKLRQ